VPKNKLVMFPTTHDISPFYLDRAISAIHELISAGNRLLLVSTPHLKCIRRICAEAMDCSANIVFRFSIGSLRDDLAAF